MYQFTGEDEAVVNKRQRTDAGITDVLHTLSSLNNLGSTVPLSSSSVAPTMFVHAASLKLLARQKHEEVATIFEDGHRPLVEVLKPWAWPRVLLQNKVGLLWAYGLIDSKQALHVQSLSVESRQKLTKLLAVKLHPDKHPQQESTFWTKLAATNNGSAWKKIVVPSPNLLVVAAVVHVFGCKWQCKSEEIEELRTERNALATKLNQVVAEASSASRKASQVIRDLQTQIQEMRQQQATMLEKREHSLKGLWDVLKEAVDEICTKDAEIEGLKHMLQCDWGPADAPLLKEPLGWEGTRSIPWEGYLIKDPRH